MPPAGENWCSYYQRTATPKYIVSGKSKGRTLRAMRDRYQSLLDHEHTLDCGMALKQYYDQAMVLHEHRKGVVDPALSMNAVKTRMTTIKNLLGYLPALLSQKLLSMVLHNLRIEQKWTEVANLLNPFAPQEEFDCNNPKMAAIPRVHAWKFLSFKQTLFKEILLPMLPYDKDKLEVVAKVTRAALVCFEQVDVIDLDDAGATQLRETLVSLRALDCIATMPINGQHMVELKEMVAACEGHTAVAKDSSIGIVYKAVTSVPFYDNRMKTMRAAEAIFRDRLVGQVSIDAQLASLEEKKGSAEADTFIEPVCADVEKLSKVLPPDVLSAHADKVLSAVRSHIAVALAGGLPAGRLQLLQTAAQSASGAYPQNKEIDELVRSISEHQTRISQNDRDEALKVAADAVAAIAGPYWTEIDQVKELTTQIAGALNRADGVHEIMTSSFDLTETVKKCSQ